MDNKLITLTAAVIKPIPKQSSYSNSFTAYDKASSTKDAYLSDWEDFCRWCQQNNHCFFPASPETVADYLDDRASNSWIGPYGKQKKWQEKPPLKWNSLQRRLAAISKIHKNQGIDFNRRHPAIAKTLDGMKRKLSKERTHQITETRKDPLVIEDIRGMIESLPDTLTGLRDRAILLIGFAGALRRSELAGIKFEHAKFLNEGLEIFLPWTKTGPRTVAIPYGSNPLTCPVRVLIEWIDKAELRSLVNAESEEQKKLPESERDKEGALPCLFRAINKHGQIQAKGLTGASITLIIKRNAYLIHKVEQKKGVLNYGGHSLRSGFATMAAREQVPEHLAMIQGGWKKSDTFKKYIREADKWKNNAATKLGL